jgi:hypothetical protein
MKIGEEAAPTLGSILERSGDMPRFNESSVPQASALGRRPTHQAGGRGYCVPSGPQRSEAREHAVTTGEVSNNGTRSRSLTAMSRHIARTDGLS